MALFSFTLHQRPEILERIINIVETLRDAIGIDDDDIMLRFIEEHARFANDGTMP